MNILSLDYAKKAADAIMNHYKAQELEPPRFFAYFNGVFLEGIERIYDVTKEEKYFNYIKEWVDFNLNEDGTIRESGKWARLTSLDFRKAGTLLFRIYEKTGDIKYWKIIEYLVESLKYYPKNEYGGFWHNSDCEEQMWLDGLYMAGPICVMYAAKSGKKEYFDMAIRQAEIMWEHMRDSKTGLMYHGWDPSIARKKAPWADKETGLSPEVWGRALGWYAVAICDMLEYIPENHPKREKLIKIVSTLLKTVIEYQDKEDGRWYEVIDKGGWEGNWLENSCSCLFVNALAQAINKGYLEKRYMENLYLGYNGIINSLKYDANGNLLLQDICIGTAIESGTYDYYINRERCTNDLHGSGTFILMCCHMDALNNERHVDNEKRKRFL